MIFINNKKGIAAILTITIVAAASLIMAYTASLLGIGELELGYNNDQGNEAFSIAEGCIEEALIRLKKDDTYSGGSLSLGDGSCIIGVSGSGGTRSIYATSTLNNYYKAINADISITGNNINITSWDEISP